MHHLNNCNQEGTRTYSHLPLCLYKEIVVADENICNIEGNIILSSTSTVLNSILIFLILLDSSQLVYLLIKWYQSLYLWTLTMAHDTRSQDMKKLEGAIARANKEQGQWNDKMAELLEQQGQHQLSSDT